MQKFRNSILASTLSVSLAAGSLSHAQSKKPVEKKVDRPPQFVLLAFDGSRENAFWAESRSFAKNLESQLNKPVKFTYFISGVYWLTDSNKDLYQGPRRKAGRSDIGFGDEKKDVLERINHLNDAFEEGHEVASHANGHFDGSDLANKKKSSYAPWTQEDWTHEFKQFNDLLFGVFQNNKIRNTTPYSTGYAFSQKDITGFRAPVLGVTEGLWPTLVNFGFKYDTSKVNFPWYWPTKDKYGLWQFPLAEIAVVGTGKKTLSMDYNFYVVHSKGVRDEANKDLYKKQMYDSYMKYFNDNYYGKRAPIHIGHHFSRWNGGAYWEAMQDFARSVCGQEEVQCVTYAEYTKWLESIDADTYNAYRKTQFDRLKAPTAVLAASKNIYDVDVKLSAQGNNLEVQTLSQSPQTLKDLNAAISVNGQLYNVKKIDLNKLREKLPQGSKVEISAHVFNRKGIEVDRATHFIEELGTDVESISSEPWEARALMGDLPEAHFDN